MNRLYRRLKVALACRDKAALADLVRSHPEAHDGCDRRRTPVEMIAAAGLDLLEAALCIKYGADIERRNVHGETALGYACSWGLPVVQLLVAAGVDVNAVEHEPDDGCRNTALDCCSSHQEIAAYLRGVGAKHVGELEDGASPGA